MAITRDRPARTITLSQSHYIGQILEKFEMTQASPIATPLPFSHQLAPPTSPSSSFHPYAELVGSLMYAMMCTRPDLTYPISVLARFVGKGRHTKVHWKAPKRVLHYLRGTKDHALTLGGSSPPLLSGISESSWADSQPDRRSSQGYGFTLGSGLDPVYHARSKHIELRYFFIRELIQRSLLAVRKIAAEANLADIFTKALLRPAHSPLLRLIGLFPFFTPLSSPPPSSLPNGPDPESDSLRAASPTVTRFLATALTDPSLESTAAFALVAKLVNFAAAYRLDYAASLLAESESVCPTYVGGECALGTDVLEDRQEEFKCFATTLPHLVSMLLAPKGDPDAPDIPTPRSYAEAIMGPYSSQWQTAMDTKMASWKSTGTYVDEVPPPGANC
ncbi:unnamed protein product [Closterium sp. NIES-54]